MKKSFAKNMIVLYYTQSFTTERSKVSAFFIEKYLYFIETFDVILFTIEVNLVICPYFSQKEF